MATREAVFRLRSEFDASGTGQAIEASGKVSQAAGRESMAFEGASESALHLEVSKRRLIRTTASLTGDVALMATRGASMGTILNTAGTSVMFLTHSLGSLAGPLGIALLLAGAAVEGYLHFAEKQETAAEKAEKLGKALEEAKKSLESARSAFQAGLFSKEQLAAIQLYSDNLEKQKNAFKPIEETAKAQKGLLELISQEQSLRAKIGRSEAFQAEVEKDRNFGAQRRAEMVATEVALQAKLAAQLKDVLAQEKEQQIAGNRTLAARANLAKSTKQFTEEEVKFFAEARQAETKAEADAIQKRKAFKEKELADDVAREREKISRLTALARQARSSAIDLIVDQYERERAQENQSFKNKKTDMERDIALGKESADALVQIEIVHQNKLTQIDRASVKARVALSIQAAQQVGGVMGQLADFMEKSGSHSFRAMKALRVAEAVINTAAGVAQALGTIPPPYSFIAAGAVAAAGAIQVATIMRTEPGGSGSGPGIGSIGGGTSTGPGPGQGTGPSATSITSGGGGGGGPMTVNIYFEKGSIALQALNFDDLPPGAARRVGRAIVNEVSMQLNGLGGAIRS